MRRKSFMSLRGRPKVGRSNLRDCRASLREARNDGGFTLVELLLVVTILGILAAIALPRFFPQAEKSRVSEAIGMLGAIRQGEEAYFLENNAFCDPIAATGCPNGWGSLGIGNPNTAANSFFGYTVYQITGTNFIALATRNALSGGDTTRTIGLDRNGTYCGNHPNTPPNGGAAAAACPA